MDENTNQNNFWLAWDATCAGADCVDGEIIRARIEERCREKPELRDRFRPVSEDIEGTAGLALDMNKSINRKFREAVAHFNKLYGGRRNSDYADVILAWEDEKPSMGCAFSVVESKLYANKSIKGRPFKEYLMEDIGERKGSLSSNLYGYVKQTIRSIVKESFSKIDCVEEKTDDEGHVMENPKMSTDSRWDYSSLPPDVRTDVGRISDFFVEYVDALSRPDGDDPAAWDCDNWISLYCAVHHIRINNPEVRNLCKRKKSALADVYNKTVGNLLLALRWRLKAEYCAVKWALESEIPLRLDVKMRDMPFYAELERIRKSRVAPDGPKAEKCDRRGL